MSVILPIRRLSVSNHDMRVFAITAMLLVSFSGVRASQDKTNPEREYVQRCTPKVAKSLRHGKAPDIHFRKGERYTHSPVVAFEILESGEIANAVLKRSSGVADADKYALSWVRELKYNKRPGCGVVESKVDVTIDFTSAE